MNGRVCLLLGVVVLSAQMIGCGSSGSGDAEVTGSRMSLAAAQRGCRVVCATCAPGTPCPQNCRLDCPPGVTPCGAGVCTHGYECCNASCGICTPPGGFCTQQFCSPPPVCVETVLCIRGFHWSPEACQCVPDEAAGSCTLDADCRVFSDYCTGCDCRALSNDDPDPTCDGPGVRCFADPCMNKTAECVRGQCVLSSRCVETQLCIHGSHWSTAQCACVRDRVLHRPHTPHRPHVPRGPHAPGHLPAAARGCVSSGGTVSNDLCCGSASDFPNTCALGACGCAPSSSHVVHVCDCGDGACFNGTACVTR